MTVKIKFALMVLSFIWCQASFGSSEASLSESTIPKPEKTDSTPKASATLNIKVPASVNEVWQILVDFGKYPQIFNRVESIEVTKHAGNLVYVESHLKSHMFVKEAVQHTVNDLSGKPGILRWRLLDGNFKHVDGTWELSPGPNNSCRIKYIIALDPGPVIPAALVSLVLQFVQHEVADQLKHYIAKRNKDIAHQISPIATSLSDTTH